MTKSVSELLYSTDAAEEQIILELKIALQQEGKAVIFGNGGPINVNRAATRLDSALEKSDEKLSKFTVSCAINSNNFGNIIRKSKKLSKLSIRYEVNNEMGQSIAHLLQNTSTLTELNLEFASITPDAARLIAQAITTNNTLKNLVLCRIRIDSKSLQLLIEAIAKNTNLQLDLLGVSGAVLTPEIASSLIQIIQTKKTLTHLTLFHIIADQSFFTLIANWLKTNPNLNYLGLRGAKLGDKSAIVFADALENNLNLRTLDFSDNAFSSTSSKAFAKALTKNIKLKTLRLGNNPLGDEGVIDLAQALETNKALIKLELGETRISDTSILAIAQALEKNSNLSNLKVAYNQIGDNGAIALANILKKNKHLKKLDLYKNDIGDEGIKAIAEAIETNSALKQLNLNGNYLTKKNIEILINSLEKNFSIIKFHARVCKNNEYYDEFTGRLNTYLSRNKKMPDENKIKEFSKHLLEITPLTDINIARLICSYMGILPEAEEPVKKALKIQAKPSHATSDVVTPPNTNNSTQGQPSLFDKFKNGLYQLYTSFAKFCSTALEKLKRIFSSKKESTAPTIVRTTKAPSTTVSIAQPSDVSENNAPMRLQTTPLMMPTLEKRLN